MEKLTKILSFIISIFGKGVSWLSFLLVIIICLDVISRYLFNFSVAWVTELQWQIFGLLFLFGSAYALSEEKHVRVDLFYCRFTTKEKSQVNVIGTILFLIPWGLTIGWFSFKYAYTSFLIQESSPDPGGLGALYLIKFAIPFGMFLLFLQGIVILLSQIKVLINRN